MSGGERRAERLLGVILDSVPAAMVLVGETGSIVFTNAPARELFFGGEEATGQNFLQLLATAPDELRRPMLSETDQIFTYGEGGSDSETYHLAKRHFSLDGEPHTLITVRHMTHEIARQENLVLKKTLRVIGHELGNSMAPASSLLRSAQQLASRYEAAGGHLGVAISTALERLEHLHNFLTGLAQLGKLPRPRKRDVAWAGFLDGLRQLWPEARVGVAPAGAGWFDPAQIQQVLINLVKNAVEAGSPLGEVSLDVELAAEGGHRLSVSDRGPGMSDEVLQKALVPAFTTKASGSGMGLALCRDIVEGHDGRLRLRLGRREGGGTLVSFWLPARQVDSLASRARLTLTGMR